jgi:hypothetical protein
MYVLGPLPAAPSPAPESPSRPLSPARPRRRDQPAVRIHLTKTVAQVHSEMREKIVRPHAHAPDLTLVNSAPVILALSCLLLASSMEAQTLGDLGGCAAVASFVSAGHADTSTTRVGPYYYIIECPAERVTALASALLATRVGTPEYTRMQLYAIARRIRDETIANAALQVANDRSADDRARAYAIRLLLQYLHFDWWPSLDEMASGLDKDGQARSTCLEGRVSSHPVGQVGDPLTTQLIESLFSDLDRIASDPTETPFVRNVAACWESVGKMPSD